MEQRVVEFIRGLRAAGVRISLAESIDAFNAIETIGIGHKDLFRTCLRATLIKEHDDFQAFEELFSLYFGSGGPPLQNALEDLSEDEQGLLQAALSALSGRLQQLMDWLTSGQGPSKEQLEEMAQQAGVQWANNQQEARWVTRRMLQQMGFGHLEEQLAQMVEKLQEMGMSQEAIEKLMGVVEANQSALAEQVAQQIGMQIAQQRADQPDDQLRGSDLMNKPLQSLTEEEAAVLRQEVQRLVTQLRSRAALRRKRGSHGRFDAKSTIRSSQRYGGVPVELKWKTQKLKPSLVLICDVSTSMRAVAEFMLRLTYELQDQVAKARSFAFNSDMREISVTFSGGRGAESVTQVLYDIPPGYYATDFGHSLQTFFARWLDAVNGRTTVVILGDARNNYNSPRLDLMKELQRRAKRVIWMTPEIRQQWGSGDSDMWDYLPVCDDVFVVRNLAQLATAVDRLLTGR